MPRHSETDDDIVLSKLKTDKEVKKKKKKKKKDKSKDEKVNLFMDFLWFIIILYCFSIFMGYFFNLKRLLCLKCSTLVLVWLIRKNRNSFDFWACDEKSMIIKQVKKKC